MKWKSYKSPLNEMRNVGGRVVVGEGVGDWGYAMVMLEYISMLNSRPPDNIK